eukprot:CAMPEP_0171933302 /NCGR_PEP_ID=MMETSP0993-20121228/31134_1 /TAXON_ID=483369 /ORGANISM="non described non described, Strain CCMP2098" /LENGTH=81 /DNA_ID=CAMNT_0012573777 /DNA_START=180 /DNA_END=423 /DNA_ORIENTATION=-
MPPFVVSGFFVSLTWVAAETVSALPTLAVVGMELLNRALVDALVYSRQKLPTRESISDAQPSTLEPTNSPLLVAAAAVAAA